MCARVLSACGSCCSFAPLTFSVSSVLLSKIKPMQLRTTSRRRALLNTELAFPVIDTETQRWRTSCLLNANSFNFTRYQKKKKVSSLENNNHNFSGDRNE